MEKHVKIDLEKLSLYYYITIFLQNEFVYIYIYIVQYRLHQTQQYELKKQ